MVDWKRWQLQDRLCSSTDSDKMLYVSRFCCEDEKELTSGVMYFSLRSRNLLFKFINYLQEECKLRHSGRFGYIDAISELIDFRKRQGALEAVLQKFSATELYLKRICKTDIGCFFNHEDALFLGYGKLLKW